MEDLISVLSSGSLMDCRRAYYIRREPRFSSEESGGDRNAGQTKFALPVKRSSLAVK
jgi:hypothetical protein